MQEGVDLEANNAEAIKNDSKNIDSAQNAPAFEPIRSEPIQPDLRKRRLDRHFESKVPEIHIVGQIIGGFNLAVLSDEGTFCRWKVDAGKVWKHLGGDLVGQTQISYSMNQGQNCVFHHPIDIHFALTGLQGWGPLRISIQSFRLDSAGRRVVSGYGFLHIPLAAGLHKTEVNLWRPVGSPDQELRAYLLGEVPTLISQDPIYEAAWKDRCRLLTTTAGTIYLELFTVTRFLKEQQVESTI